MLARLDLHMPSYAANARGARIWPGPLTLVLPGGERRVPPQLRGPEGGVAVRWTSHPALRASFARTATPITSTSANRPGVPPAMTRRGDSCSSGRTPWRAATLRVLDGGRLAPSRPSTVVDCMGRIPA